MDALVTPRLVLHPLTPAEAQHIVEGRPWPGARWAPDYPNDGDRAGAGHFLEHCAATGNPQPFGAYEIRLREDGQAIGGAGFHGVPDERGQVTIGYGLTPAMRGKGYASEALRALLTFARGEGVASVKGDADLGNTASQYVMAAAGMRFVGEDDRLRHYRIDWPAGRADAYADGSGDCPGGRSDVAGADTAVEPGPSPQVPAARHPSCADAPGRTAFPRRRFPRP
ncbi:GNAT family N-acetyltransferase [Streptomyces sp. NBC_00316]|uniref:GNAT family N-acetyltransferase n=1 Tax=Streptomyces sp. NBC_00316 TaxID=2975710 RepID=UPI002E2BC492|nr:GNAT family N-acetyltransferase [Streptomyces sp. NBC_00316]